MPAPASPAPLAPPRRRFPVRQKAARDQLSLFGLAHALETHPELPDLLRPVVRSLRVAVSEYRAVDVQEVE